MARTAEQRARDEQRMDHALSGKLLPAHDRRIHAKVVGVVYANGDGSSRQDAIGKISQFDEVDLVRDPNDRYDGNAVKVLASIDGRKVQVGMLPREIAADVAPEIDGGKTWKAIATRVGGPYTKGLSLLLYRLGDIYRQDDIKPAPSFEDIQQRAYEIHLRRGAHHGYHDQDWAQAELELARECA